MKSSQRRSAQQPDAETIMPRTARGLAARERILTAAARVLAESGEIEVASVAARAGVSDGLPYRYFGHRSGLIAAIVEDFHQRLSEAATYATFEGSTWQERELRRVTAWVHFLYHEPLSPVVLGGLGGDTTVAERWQRSLRLAIDVGTRNIASAQRAGDLPRGNDSRLLAAAILGGVQTAVATALASTPRPSERAIVAALWTFVRGAAEAVPSTRRRGEA